MKRLLQFGAILMLIGAFYPLLDFLDRWDTPGFSNDTEFKVYAFLFAICLVVILCKLISSSALKLNFLSSRAFLHDARIRPVEAARTFIFSVPPLFALSLRI